MIDHLNIRESKWKLLNIKTYPNWYTFKTQDIHSILKSKYISSKRFCLCMLQIIIDSKSPMTLKNFDCIVF